MSAHWPFRFSHLSAPVRLTVSVVLIGATATCDKSPTVPRGVEEIGGATLLAFPLAGLNERTAKINAVFDHSMITPYTSKDGRVVAFTGDEGNSGPSSDCYAKVGGGGFSFGSLGTYRGTMNTGFAARLCYDGHPGIDYYAEFGTAVYAAISGTVSYATPEAGSPNTDAGAYHVVSILPDNPSNFHVQYLHLSTWWDGQKVTKTGPPPSYAAGTCSNCPRAGDRVTAGVSLIGYSGDYLRGDGGVGAHLHFEVSTSKGIPVDPYGWRGSGPDPYTRAANIDLWATAPAPSGTLTLSSTACTIPSGASSCTVNATWSTTNPVGTSAITSNTPSANTSLASGNSGTAVALTVLYPTRTFYLYNNLQELDSKTATDSCAAGTTWNGSTCAVQQTAPTVTVSLEVISTSSSYGSLRLSWSSTNATSCSGTENPPGTDTAGWSGTPTAVGTAHGGMLFLVSRTTTFMITCTGPGGTSNDSKTIVVPP